MRMNVFRGARCIALLLGAIWVAARLGYGALRVPVPQLFYQVDEASGRTQRVEACGEHTIQREVIDSMPSGKWQATFCYERRAAKKGGRNVWPVFRALDDGERLRNARTRQHWLNVGKFGLGGLVLGWVLVSVVGRIARRSLGISRGRDA